MLTTPDAAPRVIQAGLPFEPIFADRTAEVWSIANTAGPVRGRPWRLWRQFHDNLGLMTVLRREIEAVWRTNPPDLALVDFTLPCVGHWALARGVRWWTSHASPLAIETPDGTPSYLGGWQPRNDALGRMRDAAGRRLVRIFKRVLFGLYGAKLRALGLPGVYRADGSEHAYSPEAILALTWQPLEFPRTWPAAVRFLGPVLYTPRAADSAGEPILDPARPNVLVTLGTHLPYARAAMRAALRRWAEALPGVFFHYTTGGGESTGEEEGVNWRVYRYLNYESGVDRFSAIVHHGGAGIVHHALRAGVACVVWPQDYDQFDFAARLEYHGLARCCRRAGDVPKALSAVLDDRNGAPARTAAAAALRGLDFRASLHDVLRKHGLIDTGGT